MVGCLPPSQPMPLRRVFTEPVLGEAALDVRARIAFIEEISSSTFFDTKIQENKGGSPPNCPENGISINERLCPHRLRQGLEQRDIAGDVEQLPADRPVARFPK